MKKQILHTIYTLFADWSGLPEAACQAGCSTCCTRNVTITAVEGELILRWVQAEGLASWLGKVLKMAGPGQTPAQTTNEFARACLEGREGIEEAEPDLSPCPFLDGGICRIYPVRPFACRVFISTVRCRQGQAAVVPEEYFLAATARLQLIEHLGQRESWGNMFDVLPALLDIGEFATIAAGLNPVMTLQARLRTRSASPLPGFLLPEGKEAEAVRQLLDTVFARRIDGRRIDDILNGR
ncbi:MAG TPA: hypothetical protein VK857_09235 [Desulforhopalus sp.]|nr:hypothetical protein [Desulforhopalus sp.]